jgi:dihydrolipoamide dehydrogenase
MSSEHTAQTQLVVIGAGPGGYGAAFHAADRGMSVVLVDADSRPGGTCLIRGCIPSKVLLHAAHTIEHARAAKSWGIEFGEPRIDLAALRTWKSTVVDRLAGGIRELAKRRKVRIISARARFLDSHCLELTPTAPAESTEPARLQFEHAIIATGSVPAAPPALQVDDARVLDSTSALELPDVPQRLLIVGGGYIGLELGSVYAALGSRVVVVELTDGLLPGIDRDLVRPLARRLERSFEAIHLNTCVERLERDPAGVVARLRGEGVPPTEAFDRVLVAVGRRPNAQQLGLEHTQVRLDPRGFVQVDAQRRTHDPAIFAIGDVAGEPMLAHKAAHEAKAAVAALAGENAAFNPAAIPAVVFTDPEIAWCGLTEAQTAADNRPVRITRFPWTASGRAQSIGRTDGLTKLIFDPDSQRLIGAGIVGAGAGELIAEAVLAIATGATAGQLAGAIHPHPTLTEATGEAAEALWGMTTHLYDPRRRT